MKRQYLIKQETKQFLVIVMFFFTALSFGQEINNGTYRFVNANAANNVNDYIVAFSTADMTTFRYKDKSNTIEFENGLRVELYSANHLVSIGKNVDLTKIIINEPVNKDEYVFDISADGKYILQRFTKLALKRK